MACNVTTFQGIKGYYNCPRFMRRNIRDELVNSFKLVQGIYPAGDPYGLRRQMSPEDYLNFVDAAEEGGGGDE